MLHYITLELLKSGIMYELLSHYMRCTELLKLKTETVVEMSPNLQLSCSLGQR